MDYRPPGSSVHEDSPGKNTGVGCHALLQGIFRTQGSNLGLPHCRWVLYQLSHQGIPRIWEWVACPFSTGSAQPRNQTGVSCIAGGSLPAELPGKPNHLYPNTKLKCFKKIKIMGGWVLRTDGFERSRRDFPGGLVVKTPHFQCRGHGFNPWLGN